MSVALKELVYDPAVGRDVLTTAGVIDFDAKAPKSPEEAAKAFYKALCAYCEKAGYDTKYIMLAKPGEFMSQNSWCVVWEDGPYQWAIGASFLVSGPWGYTEPYYGFDLSFVE